MKLSNELWKEYFHELADDEARSGPKPKTSFRNQFKVLLLDLWVAWKEDPALSIGVPLSSNAWDTNSRYNALHISKKIIPIIHKLRDDGLVDFAHPNLGHFLRHFTRRSVRSSHVSNVGRTLAGVVGDGAARRKGSVFSFLPRP